MPVLLRDIAEALLQLLANRERGALATVVQSSGSTPQKPGSRLLLLPDGTTIGTVGGGAIELAVLDALREAVRTGQSQVFARDLGYDLAMCCGGRMEIFIEPIEPVPRLVVCGAGHVAKAAAPMARTVGFDVTVVDDREELNTEERFPGCERALVEPPEFLRSHALGDCDWLLIATHDHALDEKTLEHSLAHAPRYVGLVGSERKVIRIVQRIVARRGPFAVDHLYAPVGVDLGAASPEEIAVSIVAELVALRHGRPANHLRVADDARFAHALRIAREAAK
ncbi:MAG TPA: XdhC/CoxI family protein [Polyangiaceae bacterium]|jgi:xanthine dehydrogenase accessory factor